MTTRTRRTAEEWTTYLAARKADVAKLQAQIAAGEDEVTAAHSLGFGTRRDLEHRVAAAIASQHC